MSEIGKRIDADAPAIEAWEALLRVQATLTPILAEIVEKGTGLPLSWYDVLLELNRAPGRQLRMQDLGARVVLSRSRVSRVVDEMVEDRLVDKIPDPADGRATLAHMTRRGADALRRAAPIYLEAIAKHFGEPLSAGETSALQSGLVKVLREHDAQE